MQRERDAWESVFSGIVAGCVSGFVVAAAGSVLALAVGSFDIAGLPGAFTPGHAIFVSVFFGIFGAPYGALLGAVVSILGCLAFPKALANDPKRLLVAYMVGGGLFGSVVSCVISRHRAEKWFPAVVIDFHGRDWTISYFGPDILIAICAALGFLLGLAFDQHRLSRTRPATV